MSCEDSDWKLIEIAFGRGADYGSMMLTGECQTCGERAYKIDRNPMSKDSKLEDLNGPPNVGPDIP